MIDNTNIYFFHNVYGDVEELLKNKPENVVSVPFGWTEEAEINRNNILQELNLSVSNIPCLVFWKNEEVILEKTENVLGNLLVIPSHTIEAHWSIFDLHSMEKENWVWEKINTELLKLI